MASDPIKLPWEIVFKILSNFSEFNQQQFKSLSTEVNNRLPSLYVDLKKTLYSGKYLDEAYIIKICKRAKKVFLEESSVLHINGPITVCGNTTGQYFDLLNLISIAGEVPETRYLFLGSYVDRGHHGVEVMTLLLLLKIRYPTDIYLLRGNHECSQISQIYGFYDECIQKYGSEILWRMFIEVFDTLPLSAIIHSDRNDKDSIFCVHGGISPLLKKIDDIAQLTRPTDVGYDGLLTDILWCDPEDITGWGIAGRGPGYIFGEDIVDQFLHSNDLGTMIRSHQLVEKGYKYMFRDRVLTLWSAPNYCYRCDNEAAYAKVRKIDNLIDVVTYSAVNNQKGENLDGYDKSNIPT